MLIGNCVSFIIQLGPVPSYAFPPARRGGVSTPTDIAQRAARITRALHNLGSDWKWNRKCKTCPVFVKAGSGQGDQTAAVGSTMDAVCNSNQLIFYQVRDH